MRNIFYFILCFTCINSWGQTDTLAGRQWRFGINAGSNLQTWLQPSITAAFTVKKKQHYASIGPKFFFSYNDRSEENRDYGIDLSYWFIPNHLHRRINFFFCTLFNVTYHRYLGVSYIGNNYSSQTTLAQYIYLNMHIGYGFDVRFLRRFHLNQYIGIGAITHSDKTTRTITGKEPAVSKTGFFHEVYPSLLVNLGFGMDLGQPLFR